MLPSRVGKKSIRIHTTHVKDVNEAKLEFGKVLNDIATANYRLQAQTVFLANMHYNAGLTAVRYHTYLVSGKPNSRLPQHKARVYGFVVNYWRKAFVVTKTLANACKTLKIHPKIKKAVKSLIGNKYDDVAFFAEDVQWISGLSAKECYEDIKEINYFYYVLYGARGSYVPMSKPFKEDHVEIVNFECNNADYIDAHITPLNLLTTLDEQRTYQLYREEKLNIQKSSTANIEQNLIRTSTQQQKILADRVEHVELPKYDYQSNCNSATAAFLQFALNRRDGISTLTHRDIVSKSKSSYGINHRPHMLHDPLAINDFLKELQDYATLQNAEANSFWGWLWNRTKEIKTYTAEETIKYLTGEPNNPLGKNERAAANEGRLGDIFKKYRVKL